MTGFEPGLNTVASSEVVCIEISGSGKWERPSAFPCEIVARVGWSNLWTGSSGAFKDWAVLWAASMPCATSSACLRVRSTSGNKAL